MRVYLASEVDPLLAELDRAFQILESVGVTRDRAKTVSNGVMVFEQRMKRELTSEREAHLRLRDLLRAYRDAERLYDGNLVAHDKWRTAKRELFAELDAQGDGK